MRTCVVITTLNEASTIGDLVRQLKAAEHYVIVVDGGSADNTVNEARLAGAGILSNGRNPIGYSLLWGFDIAITWPFDRYIQMDAGGSHDPQDLNKLTDGHADVVIGSRFVNGSEYIGRPWRKVMSRLAGMGCNLMQSGMNVKDWTSGYRAYTPIAIKEILRNNYRTVMHTWNIEALARCGAAGLSIQEVPITYRAGKSSVNVNTANDLIHVWLHMANHIGWRA